MSAERRVAYLAAYDLFEAVQGEDHAGAAAALPAASATAERQRRTDTPHRATAPLLVDLDQFKPINDTHGHACGDEVLRRVGRLMRASVRPGDLALRHGGDEFAIVLEDECSTTSAVMERARDLRTAISGERWSDLAPGLAVTASIGAAVAVPQRRGEPGARPGWDAASIYRAADAALYAAKREGSGLVVVPDV